MKLIIDIPKYEYEHIREYYEKNDTVESTYSYIYHGTPIPDNATNGDVIKTMFPNNVFAEDRYEYPEGDYIEIISDNGMSFTDECWNAPYQKGGK